MTGLTAAGPKILGLAALGLEVVRFKQYWVHCTDAAETTSVTKTAECNVAKPDVGKLRARPCHFRQTQQSTKPKNKSMISYILAIYYPVLFVNVKKVSLHYKSIN